MNIPERLWLGSIEPMNDQQKKDSESFLKRMSEILDSAFAKTKNESIESGLVTADQWLEAEMMAKEMMERAK